MRDLEYNFPELQTTDAVFDDPAIPSGESCRYCQMAFDFAANDHTATNYCLSCNGIFCCGCSSYKSRIPKYGVTQWVNVCNDCYVHLRLVNELQGVTSLI